MSNDKAQMSKGRIAEGAKNLRRIGQSAESIDKKVKVLEDYLSPVAAKRRSRSRGSSRCAGLTRAAAVEYAKLPLRGFNRAGRDIRGYLCKSFFLADGFVKLLEIGRREFTGPIGPENHFGRITWADRAAHAAPDAPLAVHNRVIAFQL